MKVLLQSFERQLNTILIRTTRSGAGGISTLKHDRVCVAESKRPPINFGASVDRALRLIAVV